ncbi:metalloprotease [Halomicrobium salinisoli]|uniref:metalloprotease n=1 Tax=Halomicrobium salinisoli TaxID=2878391 RepID=UPI003B8A62C1
MNVQFSDRELRDLGIAWLALGFAFAVFIDRSLVRALSGSPGALDLASIGETFLLSLLTAGVGFLLHELAHKVVAIRFGQVAEFRADYNMLFLAVVGGLAGFLFAAPGAVYHRGRITARENGLISVAGPVTNLVLAAVFLGVLVAGASSGVDLLGRVGNLGLWLNLLLAGFNMIPFGPLDGKKVLAWNKLVYAAVAVPSIGLALLVIFGL